MTRSRWSRSPRRRSRRWATSRRGAAAQAARATRHRRSARPRPAKMKALTALARLLAFRNTLTRVLVALGVVLVGINVASAIWDVRIDRERTESRARRDLSNI